MGRTSPDRSQATKRSKASADRKGERAMAMAVRYAEKRRGTHTPRIQGRRFEAMMNNTPLALSEWASAVHLSPRTLHSRIRDNKDFDALQSDRMVLIMHVMERGQEVFGDADRFRRWLDSPRPGLGGRKPVDRLDDLAGIGEVLAELGRIEHGVF